MLDERLRIFILMFPARAGFVHAHEVVPHLRAKVPPRAGFVLSESSGTKITKC